jgi:hypothetical protein
MNSTCPPIAGEIFARRRAVTVPALLLLTDSSTVPCSTFCSVTGTGGGRNTVRRNPTPTATIAATTANLLSQRTMERSGKAAETITREWRLPGSRDRRRDAAHPAGGGV